MEIFRKAIVGNDVLRVLKIKPFLLMMSSEFFSQLAFNMQQFILIFIIFAATRSNTAVSGLILSFTIPAILFSVFAGVFIDRWDKRRVMLFANLARALFLLPFLISDLHIGFIYTFAFLIAIATQFFIPAEAAIIPSLIPKKLIISGNAVFAFGIYSTMLIGYVLSGPVLNLLGRTSTIIFLVVLYFISTFFIAGIKPAYGKNNRGELENLPSRSLFREAGEIFSFIRKIRKVMHALIILTIAQAVMLIFAVLGPGYVTNILDAPLESLSWVLIIPAGIGVGIGVILIGSIGKKFRSKFISSIGFLIVGLAFILLPFGSKVTSYEFVKTINSFLPSLLSIDILHIIMVLAFIIGFSISLVFIPSNATIQIETSEEMRGRMYGLLATLVATVSFLPVILSGGLADIVGVGAVITGIGITMILLSIVFMILE